MIALCMLFFASALAIEMVDTPFGLPRRQDCVIELDSGSTVPSGQDIPPECSTDGYVEKVKAIKKQRQQLAPQGGSFPNSFLETTAWKCNGACMNTGTESCASGFKPGLCPGPSNIQCCQMETPKCQGLCQDKSLPCIGPYESGLCPGSARVQCCGGWLDNAGSYPLGRASSAGIGHFESTYLVPNTPSSTGATVFYFIGVQNNDDGPVSILQPVVAYEWQSGNGWQFFSWDCCPANVTWHSTPIPVQPGNIIQTSVTRDSTDTWTITGALSDGSGSSTLVSQVGSYVYDWADITMEVYKVTACNQFPSGTMTFGDIALQDDSGNAVTPTWHLTQATPCEGKITQESDTIFDIVHNPSAANFRSIRRSQHILSPMKAK